MSQFSTLLLAAPFCFIAFDGIAQDTLVPKQLKTVTLTASTKKKLELLPGNVTVIPTAAFYQTNQTAVDVFKRTSGVRVRQQGGYGSHTDFFLNGITGKQVKFFIDGVPADHLGETQGVGIIPLEQTERFEVYKGVVPIALGSDALGGAINLVTRKESRNVLDVSAATGSFNTYKLNLYAQQYLNAQHYVSVSGSYNTSANNYFIDGEVPNQFGNIDIKRVRRFHNDFSFKNIKVGTGFVNTRWCDVLAVELQAAATYSELQHNLIMRQPYGKADFSDRLMGALVRYQKNNLLRGLDVSTFVNYSLTKSVFTDTSLSVYNWEGKVVGHRFTGGEISSSGNLLTTDTRIFSSRQVLTYAVSPVISLSFANTFQRFTRTGTDPVATRFYGFDLFKNPQAMRKNVAGFSVEGKLLNGRLLHISSVKYYSGRAEGNRLKDFDFEPVYRSYGHWGYNTAFTYFLNQLFYVKASYERAVRLPDEAELFGDLVLIRANPGLVPEVSDNINVNASYVDNRKSLTVTGFFRNVRNTIFLPPSTLFSQYSSLLKMRAMGVEISGRLLLNRQFSVEANVTYQDLRNRSYIDYNGINSDRYLNARMPNIPYLFANTGLHYSRDSVWRGQFRLQSYWYCSYVHPYFLYWAKDGDRDLKNIVPMQLLHTLGVSVSHRKRGWSLSAEANNLFNNKAYDNFKVQLPGRNMSIKLRYAIFKPIKKIHK